MSWRASHQRTDPYRLARGELRRRLLPTPGAAPAKIAINLGTRSDAGYWRGKMSVKQATLGVGVFWCFGADLRRAEGVTDVVSGYAGGDVPKPVV